MRQIVVISGKGGTGKTVITASFAALAENKVMADCDVDAADLHLLLKPKIKESHQFSSGKTALINQEKCIQCGKCKEVCRFQAVSVNANTVTGKERFIIDPVSCEGCAFCSFACPQQAIEMKENVSGVWFSSQTRFGPMIHAKLGIAEENSGKLVSLVRKKAKEKAEEVNADWVIIDGSPGIGCPVIASLSGADCALVVTEPTLSGLHDAKRVIDMTRHFKIPVLLVVNKYDLNINMTQKIEEYCHKDKVPFIGKIIFDKTVVEAMVRGKTVIEYSAGETTKKIKEIWMRLQNEVCGRKD
ncbi:MAG: ATP-binding protein [Candidatus Omnitrophica bacterium]|nr:ATP-binding protein [Candidatus Omnitrophota bacterium]